MLLTRSDLAEIIVNKPVVDARTDPTKPPTGIVDLATGTYTPVVESKPLTTAQQVAIGVGIVGGIGFLMWLATKMPPSPPVVYIDDYDPPVVVRRRRPPVVLYEDEPTTVVDEAPTVLVNPKRRSKKRNGHRSECPCGKCRRSRLSDRAADLTTEAWRHECRPGAYSYLSTRHPDGVRRCDECGGEFEPNAALLAEADKIKRSLTP